MCIHACMKARNKGAWDFNCVIKASQVNPVTSELRRKEFTLKEHKHFISLLIQVRSILMIRFLINGSFKISVAHFHLLFLIHALIIGFRLGVTSKDLVPFG